MSNNDKIELSLKEYLDGKFAEFNRRMDDRFAEFNRRMCTVPPTCEESDILPLYRNSIWRKQLWDRYYRTSPRLLPPLEKRSKRFQKKSGN